MSISQVDQIKFSLITLWRIRKLALMIFFVLSLAILAVGWVLPKVYISSSTISVDEQNILTPLMEGTAVATSVKDQAKNAWQLLTGQYAKKSVMVFIAEDVEGLSEKEIEHEWEIIKGKTNVVNVGKNLISIRYKSSDPVEAQKFASFFTDLFIDESVKDKRRESEGAFNFIASQAEAYHEKLRVSEEGLKEFRSENLGASPDSAGTVNSRILELQRSTEQTQLDITEIEIQLKNIRMQMSGEAQVSAQLTEEGQLQERISSLQGEVDTLRMTYLDSYPDIVIIKGQIESLRNQMDHVRKQDKKEISTSGRLNPLFQQLRSQFSKLSTQLDALKIRLKATKNLLVDEKERAIQINIVDAVLAQLTRDYDVNKDLYQTLLRQRETARVSMNIDIANQGLTLKISESPIVPISPVGLRLMHFALVGIVLGLFAPLGLAFMLTLFDGHARSIHEIQNVIQAPVIGEITTYQDESYRKNIYGWFSIVFLVVSLVASIYLYVAWIRIIN
jgi:polysaccharide chain length determinant protein (PEP-CTERM system associated)